MTATATRHPSLLKSFWHKHIAGPVRKQLTQGTSPNRMAFSIAAGTACSVLPFLGFTTLLNLAVAWIFKLNQPIMQGLNQMLGAVQLVLIIVYVRLGEKIWRAQPVPISVKTLVKDFRESPKQFMERFGLTGVHAATAWLISVPLIIALVYFPARLILSKFVKRRA